MKNLLIERSQTLQGREGEDIQGDGRSVIPILTALALLMKNLSLGRARPFRGVRERTFRETVVGHSDFYFFIFTREESYSMRRGSEASRIACPSRLYAVTVIKIAMAGNHDSQLPVSDRT